MEQSILYTKVRVIVKLLIWYRSWKSLTGSLHITSKLRGSTLIQVTGRRSKVFCSNDTCIFFMKTKSFMRSHDYFGCPNVRSRILILFWSLKKHRNWSYGSSQYFNTVLVLWMVLYCTRYNK